ncbi:MAG TPA: GntR family transcriptional regulator [Plantibacter sp.]|uniref:GntR family transcriptional regulator n=2 Tax=unclassified Plantibacter TaxID=2624265 RepID=UPI002C054081|nr:GntR family transcriptional regulator [Plantibacter sp.]
MRQRDTLAYLELTDMASALYAKLAGDAAQRMTEHDLANLSDLVTQAAAYRPDLAPSAPDPLSFVTDLFLDVVDNAVLRRILHTVQIHVRWMYTLLEIDAGDRDARVDVIAELHAACAARDRGKAETLVVDYFNMYSRRNVLTESLSSMPRTQAPLTRPPRGLAHSTFEQLLAAILDGRLRPGQRLHDDQLTAALAVSRTPIREAIEALEDVGLIEVKPKSYTRVAPVNHRRVDETHEIVANIVQHLFRQLSDRSDGTIKRELSTAAHRLHDDVEHLAEPDRARVVDDLVLRLAEAAGNRPILEILPGMLHLLTYARVLEPQPGTVRERTARALLAAVNAGDAAAAASALTTLLAAHSGASGDVRWGLNPLYPTPGTDFEYRHARSGETVVFHGDEAGWELHPPHTPGRLHVGVAYGGGIRWGYSTQSAPVTPAPDPSDWTTAAEALLAATAQPDLTTDPNRTTL